MIQTDYFGGVGSQAAAVYRGDLVVIVPEQSSFGPPEKSFGPINKALSFLGVAALGNCCDEFTVVGLHQYRDFDDLFETYHLAPEDGSAEGIPSRYRR